MPAAVGPPLNLRPQRKPELVHVDRVRPFQLLHRLGNGLGSSCSQPIIRIDGSSNIDPIERHIHREPCHRRYPPTSPMRRRPPCDCLPLRQRTGSAWLGRLPKHGRWTECCHACRAVKQDGPALRQDRRRGKGDRSCRFRPFREQLYLQDECADLPRTRSGHLRPIPRWACTQMIDQPGQPKRQAEMSGSSARRSLIDQS